tara:strand:- start:654 stop:1574 length:921 start_codon:yes stop_codon:yes gene_type:complete
MKNILKGLILALLPGVVFALHGKIVFYDGTYVVGKVTKVDESSVYIVPIGLDTAEGVLVGNIDSLKVENGMVPVVNSSVKYFYQNGEFMANDSDWMDEYDDFKYNEYTSLQEEYNYKEVKKDNINFWSLSIIGGFPVFRYPSLDAVTSQDKTRLRPNFGFNFQSPFFPIGALDLSGCIRLMTFGIYDHPEMGNIDALQLAFGTSADFKPIFYFLPKNLHLNVDFGVSQSVGLKVEPKSQYDGEASYGGFGFYTGFSFDYHFDDLPIALKLFGQNQVVPQGIPFPDKKTGFVSTGISIVVALRRHSS